MQPVKTITLSMPLRMGTVNCFLVRSAAGFVLVDTGTSNRRTELETQLARAGCQSGDLKLIVLTHGDFDHTGNAAYLRDRFGVKVAMHADDAGMVTRGDMFWNRSSGNVIMRRLAPILFGFSSTSRFEPDLYLEEGDELSEYGFDAQVLWIPGHSKGSIGLLTTRGELLCGDLLENTKAPATNSIMDQPAVCQASLAKLSGYQINMVYPGHGEPFPIGELRGGDPAAAAEE